MDHNGLYTDLDSFSSITNCGTTNNSFNDTCPTLPSLSNFKYPTTNLSGNVYQQPVQTVHDQHNQQPNHSTKPASSLPQTQININNCNNNIFFPHDDGIFDANSATTTCASTTNLNSGHSQKNNYIGYVRKESGASGGGGDNITYNINNINTNIVNNINNPANDIFGGNQYHQINKNGETIINFTNNNLNASMPADTVSSTSQNYYGYQANTAGQQTVYETSVQSQSSTFHDPKAGMGTSGADLYHHQNSLNHQSMTNGSYNVSDHSTSSANPFSEYSDPLSAAKILNTFESKNPLKYQTGRTAAPYYKAAPEYPAHQFPSVGHLPPHNYPGLYQPKHNYEPYQRMARTYPAQHYATPPNAHQIDEHSASRVNYNRPYHPMPHPSNNYGNFYGNGYGAMPYSAYQQMPAPPYVTPLLRNESCSKPSTNYSKTGAVALSPVEHSNFSYAAPKKDFYNENHFFPPHPPYYDDGALNSCAKKSAGRPKANVDMYNPNGATTIYPDHHAVPPHANVIRHTNVAYQPMPPKHFSTANFSTQLQHPSDPYFNYKYGEHPKMQKISSTKQFKNFGHFEHHPPHVQYAHPPQYHTMQAKHPEKIKIDLEEQINSTKIPKAYGFDPHHHHHFYQYHHHMPTRADNDPAKNPIANINISLRDFLSTWNDEEEEAGDRRPAAVDGLNEHMERTIMREYNPMFVQKATESFADVPPEKPELDSGIISEGSEKLYVLESIDVPLSELNKYKHLSVINKLPENVVISDKELYADSMKFSEEIDLTREKLYKSEFELEFEACQERKVSIEPPPPPPPVAVKAVEKVESVECVVAPVASEVETIKKSSDSEEKVALQKKRSLKVKSPKLKSPVEKVPKILKLKKEKILKASKDLRKVRITKRVKKYSLNQQSGSVKSLKSLCVDFINTSAYRNYAREQLKIINKQSKMRILQDFKKKFNFEGIKRQSSTINQKLNLSVGINSLREICGKILNDKSRLLEINGDDECDEPHTTSDFPTLKQLCKRALTEINIDVDYVYSPPTLKELCETFIYGNRQYFLIEEVSSVPKLQDLCKNVLSETNYFINIEEEANEMLAEALQIDVVADDGTIYIVEESSGNVGEFFESENLSSFEGPKILRNIPRVASVEDDDEIIRAIGALHDDVDSVIINNNNSNVSNKNISCADDVKLDSEMSFHSYMDDDLMHAVQYEEIISGSAKVASKTLEILRHKYLNRADVRQATRTINGIVRRSMTYQRVHRLRNAERRRRSDLKRLERAALCDGDRRSTTPQHESDNESQQNAKDESPIIDDSPVDDYDDVFDDSQAELNFPKLPTVVPSINEYKIDRKSSNRSDVKDMYEAKRRKLTFDESLLSIDERLFRRSISNESRRHRHRSNSHRQPSHSRRRSRDRHHHKSSRRDHRRRSSSRSRNSYHHSSRHNNYKRDQNMHSEAKRLVIPSYKIYDKDLDVKLKIRPVVRIEREEKVDDMVKKNN